MKYIITRTDEGKEEIFIFSRDIHHDCFAEIVDAIRNQKHGNWRRINREPVSAGFIEGGKCVGRSESLNLDSRPQDSDFLKGV